MDDMRHFLTPEIISGFHEKAVEFGTTNRIYYCNPTYSTFLHPVNINGDRGECPICLVATCTICKGPSHQGDCPQDTGVQQVLLWQIGRVGSDVQNARLWLSLVLVATILRAAAKLNVRMPHHNASDPLDRLHIPRPTDLISGVLISPRVLRLRRSMEDLSMPSMVGGSPACWSRACRRSG